MHRRGCLVPWILQGQWQRSGADKGRQENSEGHIPHTAPQCIPLYAETVSCRIQGSIVKISQQLPDMEQCNGTRDRDIPRESGQYDSECGISTV